MISWYWWDLLKGILWINSWNARVFAWIGGLSFGSSVLKGPLFQLFDWTMLIILFLGSWYWFDMQNVNYMLQSKTYDQWRTKINITERRAKQFLLKQHTRGFVTFTSSTTSLRCWTFTKDSTSLQDSDDSGCDIYTLLYLYLHIASLLDAFFSVSVPRYQSDFNPNFPRIKKTSYPYYVPLVYRVQTVRFLINNTFEFKQLLSLISHDKIVYSLNHNLIISFSSKTKPWLRITLMNVVFFCIPCRCRTFIGLEFDTFHMSLVLRLWIFSAGSIL